MAAAIGENETVTIQVCKRIGNVNLPDANKNIETASVNEFIKNLSPSENTAGKTELFSGYYFRVVGNKTNELLLFAYPVEYRSSGVMTFVVRNGAVYEKDLGPQTAASTQKIGAKSISKWTPVK